MTDEGKKLWGINAAPVGGALNAERAAFEAWAKDIWFNPSGRITYHSSCDEYDDREYQAAYEAWQARAHQAGAGQAVAVPDGWKLVPLEPTDDMLDGMFNCGRSADSWSRYRAALNVAPLPPQSAAQAEDVGNAQLMKFYGVSTMQSLIDAQDKHVAKLQEKLSSATAKEMAFIPSPRQG